jgi:hypothetical protein
MGLALVERFVLTPKVLGVGDSDIGTVLKIFEAESAVGITDGRRSGAHYSSLKQGYLHARDRRSRRGVNYSTIQGLGGKRGLSNRE